MLEFPKGFFWGCATSAHQIEGGNVNDWSEWETSPERLRALGAKGHKAEDFISGAACESYVRDSADIDCLRQLGANAYRFSIEWSRIEPRPGEWNLEALRTYHDFIRKLRSHGIELFVTLWHWPVPLWVRDQGGWTSSKTADDFGTFAARVMQEFGNDVTYYVTLNEPQVYASNSYVTGEWPPQQKSMSQGLRVIRNLIRGHKFAYRAIKAAHPGAQVGIASHNIHFEAHPRLLVNNAIAAVMSRYWNHHVLRAIRNEQDFVGVNFYFTNQLHLGLGKRQAEFVSDIGWDLRPDGLYHVVKELRRYGKPIYILEHGLADKDDRHRAWYLRESLKYVHRAIAEGVDVRGYFHWSLIDNFEWAMGFHPRFGMFEVDYATCERKPRSSVDAYRKIIQANGLD